MLTSTKIVSLCLAAAAAFPTVLAAPHVPVEAVSASALEKRDCSQTYRIFAARGSNPPGDYSTTGTGQALGDFISYIQKFDPRITLDSVTYPATFDNYDNSVYQGVQYLQGMIQQAVDACPNVRIALIGYSQGANVIGNAICGNSWGNGGLAALASQYQDNIKSVVLFGDPTHNGAQTFSVGTGASSPGFISRVSNPECAPFTDKIASYCIGGDQWCASGGDGAAHGAYFSVYRVAAAWFTLRKIWFGH